MGVEYSAVSGYGFVLDDINDDIEGIAKFAGFPVDALFDSYSFYEWLSKKYNVNFAYAGDAYDGSIYVLIGAVTVSNLYGFEDVDFGLSEIESSAELNAELRRMLDDLGIDKKIGYYTGMYVY
jgi:hypothetical protein